MKRYINNVNKKVDKKKKNNKNDKIERKNKRKKKRNKNIFRHYIICICIFLIIGIVFIINTYAENNENYEILIDVESSKLWLLNNSRVEKEYMCGPGKKETPSPIGTWKIISKGKWGEGFGGSWMGLNVPWGKFGIHGTRKPYSLGWNSSHGCIRMRRKDAAELYDKVSIGTKVVIVDGVYGKFGRGFRFLKSGMYGSDVEAIQEYLKEIGIFNGEVTGRFEKDLEEAIKKYCIVNNLKVTKEISPELQKTMGFYLMD